MGKSFLEKIYQRAIPAQEREAQSRLSIREKDQKFFENYVIDEDIERLKKKLNDLLELGKTRGNQTLSDVQRNFKENAKVLHDKIAHHLPTQKNKWDFARFLIECCMMVVVTTANEESAIRIFSVMNTRGLDLKISDMLKAYILNDIKDSIKQGEYSKRWEDMEESVGRDDFEQLFQHIRMMFIQDKARRNLYDDYVKERDKQAKADNLRVVFNNPKKFIDDILIPYADAFYKIQKEQYSSDKVNDVFYWLRIIDYQEWWPVAIKFLKEKGNEKEYTIQFFERLERLAAYLHICGKGKNVNIRISRFASILKEMDNKPEHALSSPLSSIDLTDEEKNDFKEVLECDIFEELTYPRCKYLMLRLSTMVVEGKRPERGVEKPTIEHVFPQNPKDINDWSGWTEGNKNQWLHKIGNLALLSRRKNSKVGNKKFKIKRDEFFGLKYGVTPYALTNKLASHDKDWPVEHVEERQKELLEVLHKGWDL